MTKKVYYDDTWLDHCQATVLECESDGDHGYKVLLDQTVIFPEGGGQPSDTGRIGKESVTQAQEEGELIWHSTRSPFQRGEAVEVFTDMQRRRDHTQQHTGEHIVSGLASRLFGAKNVGFHMAESYATIDLDTALNEEQLKTLEEEANKAVQENLPIRYEFVNADKLGDYTLRKQAKGLEGEVRIVYVGDVDSCTCCGTHCVSSGEVGYIKISAWQNYKGGVRLWFLCGMRAVKYAAAQQGVIEELARRYSVKQEDLKSAVEKQGNELATLKYELKNRTDRLFSYQAEEAFSASESVNGLKLVIEKLTNCGMPDLKLFADKLLKMGGCIAILFSENGDLLQYQLAASKGIKLSMRELCTVINGLTGGKGGGKDDFAQGSAKAQSGFDETLQQLKTYLLSKMKE